MKSIAIENTIYRDRPELTNKLAPCTRFVRATPAYDMFYRRVESNIPRLSDHQGLVLSGPLNNALNNSNDFTLSQWRLSSVSLLGVYDFGDIRLSKVRGNRLVGSTDTSNALFHNLNIYTPVLANRQWRISALVKPSTGNIIVIEINNGTGYTKLKYDVINGAIIGSSSRFKAGIRLIRDGIYEISLHDTIGFQNPDFGTTDKPHPFGFQLNKKGLDANSYTLLPDEDSDSFYIGNVGITYVDYYPGVFYSYAHSEGDLMRSIAAEVVEQEIDSLVPGKRIVIACSSAGPVQYVIFGQSRTITASTNVNIEAIVLDGNQFSLSVNGAAATTHAISGNLVSVGPLDGGNCVFKSLHVFPKK